MTRVILIVLALMTTCVLAQNVVFIGKAHGYKGKPAELWASFDADDNPSAAEKIGDIGADGRFRFTLPAVIPDQVLAAPEVGLDCGDSTLGLKLAVLTTINLRQNNTTLGQMFFSNRLANFEDMISGLLEGSSKFVLWFYANKAGFIKENCTDKNNQRISDVTFVQGWNAIGGYYFKNGDKVILKIKNGYTEGLQRWFYLAIPQ